MRVFSPVKIGGRRTETNLTQAELAMEAGTFRVYIVEPGRSRKIPKVTMIAGIAHALDVPENFFCYQC
ncbi:MAG: helix-turn-helix transcriptional regulator [Nitrospira sp.]|nr:helix-turn-helix transcriptional regulator [Nitrospira sp.]